MIKKIIQVSMANKGQNIKRGYKNKLSSFMFENHFLMLYIMIFIYF